MPEFLKARWKINGYVGKTHLHAPGTTVTLCGRLMPVGFLEATRKSRPTELCAKCRKAQDR